MNGFSQIFLSVVAAGAAVEGAGWFFDRRIPLEADEAKKLAAALDLYVQNNPPMPRQLETVQEQQEMITALQAELEDIQQREALLMFQLNTGRRAKPSGMQSASAGRTYDVEPEIIAPAHASAATDTIDDLYDDD